MEERKIREFIGNTNGGNLTIIKQKQRQSLVILYLYKYNQDNLRTFALFRTKFIEKAFKTY